MFFAKARGSLNYTNVQYKMKQKQLYEAPWTQAFVVQPEGMICQSDPEINAALMIDPISPEVYNDLGTF